MTHFSEDDLLYTFRARWNAKADLKELADEERIHYFRREFTPPAASDNDKMPWVFEELFIADESKIATKMVQALGEVRYTVAVPENSGTEAAFALRKIIIEQFEAGQALQSADLSLRLNIYRA